MNFYKEKVMIRIPAHREPTHPGEGSLKPSKHSRPSTKKKGGCP
jgi:hypothetical protein